MIVSGWLLYGLVYLGFALASNAWQVWALFLIYAVYYAATEPAEKTLVAELMGKNKKGAAYGWYNAAIGIAALPASALFGLLYQYHALAAFGCGAGLALVAVLLLLPVRA
jgi:MFS family permease